MERPAKKRKIVASTKKGAPIPVEVRNNKKNCESYKMAESKYLCL